MENGIIVLFIQVQRNQPSTFFAPLLNQRKQRNLEEYKALRHIKPRKDHADALVIRATRAVCARELEAQVKRQSVCEGTAS